MNLHAQDVVGSMAMRKLRIASFSVWVWEPGPGDAAAAAAPLDDEVEAAEENDEEEEEEAQKWPKNPLSYSRFGSNQS